MRPLRTAAVALVATVTIVAPLATVTTAPAARADGWRPILHMQMSQAYLSPDRDRVGDKAKIVFSVREKAKVTVKVRRNNKDRTVVYKEELGKLPVTLTSWTWNGKNSHGKVVRDGRYTAALAAEAVLDGKKQFRSAKVYVDTDFDVPKKPTLSLDTLYPKTTLLHDALAVGLSGRGKLASVGRGVMKVADPRGRVVRRIAGYTTWRPSLTIVFDGRDGAGQPLPGGQYTLSFKVWDKAGNKGRSKSVTVNIADKPLVERTGTVVLSPTGSWKASEILAGTAPAPTPPASGGSGSQAYPCGTVVPSEVYPSAGAMSFRSDDTCTESFAAKAAYASGSLVMDNLTFETAPRGGLYSARVSMRGRPTAPTETDTATLTLGGPGFGFHGVVETPRGASSPAVAEESVTSTETVTTPPPVQPYYSRPTYPQRQAVHWTIVTRGVDSFDVDEVTVHFSYLAPQQ